MDIFKHLSAVTGLGVAVLDVTGEKRFTSKIHDDLDVFLHVFLTALDCLEADRTSLLYGCYQARRFGGRYIFFTPSGLAYCASHLTEESGDLTVGVAAGPFLMTDHDDFLEMDVLTRNNIDKTTVDIIKQNIYKIPYLTSAQARSVSELLYCCTKSQIDSKKYSHRRYYRLTHFQ